MEVGDLLPVKTLEKEATRLGKGHNDEQRDAVVQRPCVLLLQPSDSSCERRATASCPHLLQEQGAGAGLAEQSAQECWQSRREEPGQVEGRVSRQSHCYLRQLLEHCVPSDLGQVMVTGTSKPSPLLLPGPRGAAQHCLVAPTHLQEPALTDLCSYLSPAATASRLGAAASSRASIQMWDLFSLSHLEGEKKNLWL